MTASIQTQVYGSTNFSLAASRGADFSNLNSAKSWIARLGGTASEVRASSQRSDNFFNYKDGRQVVISAYADGGYTAEVVERGGRVFGGSVYIQSDPSGNTRIRFGAGNNYSPDYTLAANEKISLSKDGQVMITVNGKTTEARSYLTSKGYNIQGPSNPLYN